MIKRGVHRGMALRATACVSRFHCDLRSDSNIAAAILVFFDYSLSVDSSSCQFLVAYVCKHFLLEVASEFSGGKVKCERRN